MEKKYSLHKVWFLYDDSWYYPQSLATGIGFFQNREEAEKVCRALDREAMRDFGYGDYLNLLGHFIGDRYDEATAQLVAHAYSQGWHEHAHQQDSFGSTVWSLYLPDDAADEQIDSILDIMNASFHRIIECIDVKEHTYVKLNPRFWNKPALDILQQRNVTGLHNPVEEGTYYYNANQTRICLQTTLKNGNTTVQLPTAHLARELAVQVFADAIQHFPEHTWLGKTPVNEWSAQPEMLQAYLTSCRCLLYSTGNLSFVPGQEAYTEEVMGLWELLQEKPFETQDCISEINGEAVQESEEGGLIFGERKSH